MNTTYRVDIPLITVINRYGVEITTSTSPVTLQYKTESLDTGFGILPIGRRKFISFQDHEIDRDQVYTFKVNLHPTVSEFEQGKDGEIRFLYNCRWDDSAAAWEFEDQDKSGGPFDCYGYYTQTRPNYRKPTKTTKWVLRMKYV